jgi:hypothetical protein
MSALYNAEVMSSWEVEYTDEFEEWWDELTENEQERVDAAVEMLMERGPNLRRPVVGAIEGSRHPNMKELIPSTAIRVLFAFDPRRRAILLIGGDKTGEWNSWYDRMIPQADDLFDEHLQTLERERLPDR